MDHQKTVLGVAQESESAYIPKLPKPRGESTRKSFKKWSFDENQKYAKFLAENKA